jgi:hypothetical protein
VGCVNNEGVDAFPNKFVAELGAPKGVEVDPKSEGV